MIYKHEFIDKSKRERPVFPMPLPDAKVTDAASRYIYKRGLSPDLAFQNGWYGSREAGDDTPRVVIPAINRKNVPYWQARSLLYGDPTPRYQSPYSPRFDSIVVVLPWEILTPDKMVVISEGPFDALASAECGYISVGLMGNQPPFEVWNHIFSRYRYHPIVLVADADGIGQAAQWQAQLAVRGMKSKLVVPCAAKDLAAMKKDQRIQLLQGV